MILNVDSCSIFKSATNLNINVGGPLALQGARGLKFVDYRAKGAMVPSPMAWQTGGHVYISEGAVVTGFKAAKSSTILGKRI